MFGFNKKKILIIGMPDLVLYCIAALKKARKNIVGVVTSPIGAPTYDYMVNFLAQNRLLLIDNNKKFKDEAFLQKIRDLKPDIAFVCSFNYLLPKEFYEIPTLGTLNFHPSLLPDYRGANPYYHVLINKEEETGITMHFMDETFDTGDIVEQIRVKIFENDTMGSLFNRINEATAKLCLDTVNRLERGEILPRISQPKSGDFKLAPKIFADTDDVKIDWNKPIEDIELFIRALNPFFGATTTINEKQIKIWAGEIVYNAYANSLPIGTIAEITENSIYISTKQGFLQTHVLGYADTNYFDETQQIVEICDIKLGDICA